MHDLTSYTTYSLTEASSTDVRVPQIVSNSGAGAATAFLDYFTANIRNPHTRRAYAFAVGQFLDWAHQRGLTSLAQVQPVHIAGWVELQLKRASAPTVKQHLAAIRMLFDWLVVRQIMPFNPTAAVRGPKHSVKRGKTPVLEPSEARAILDAIPIDRIAGLRDRALIGVMVYTFARVGAATALKVGDVFWQQRRLWLALHEKGGKRHAMPCHHNLERYLLDYIEAAGIGAETEAPLFRTMARGMGSLSQRPMVQGDVWSMVQRRAKDVGIRTHICNHTFRATGITAYLKNGGTIETAAAMAAHESTRTTQLYDRRSDPITLDEVERVLI